MAMSTKDYVAVAAVMKENYDAANGVDSRDAVRGLIGDLASLFAKGNPRFDLNKFLAAAGVA